MYGFLRCIVLEQNSRNSPSLLADIPPNFKVHWTSNQLISRELLSHSLILKSWPIDCLTYSDGVVVSRTVCCGFL